MESAKIDHILVDRLAAIYRPWDQIGVCPAEVRGFPATQFQPMEQRDHDYDIGRVLYFRNLVQAGAEVEPIQMDNVCEGDRVYPEPLLLDGHHRLCGYILAGAKTVPTLYGGRVDLLHFLTGKRKSCPTA